MRALLLAFLLAAPAAAQLGAEHALVAARRKAVFNMKTAAPELKARVESYRNGFITSGCRFDETEGTILAPDKSKLTVADVETILKSWDQGRLFGVLEHMNAVLAGQDLSKPLSAATRAKLKALAAVDKKLLPESLLKALEGGAKVPAKGLAADLESAYLAETKFWDGQEVAALKQTQPWSITVSPLQPAVGPTYFDETERKLGEKLQEAVAAHLAKNPVGAELLKEFAGKDGKPKLPAMMILKIAPTLGAAYSPYNKALIVNSDFILKVALEQAPAKDREALKKKLADPKVFAAELLKDPKALAAFVAEHDVVFVHELTHTLQDKRSKVDDYMGVGLIPSADVLEQEHEAFVRQNRYFHHKALADPAAALKSPWWPWYSGMLMDFERWRDGISQGYIQDNPDGAATLATVESLRKVRLAAASKLKSQSLSDSKWYPFEALKALRYRAVEPVIAKEGGLHDERMASFLKLQYPKLRYEGFLAWGDASLKAGDPANAVKAYLWAESAAGGLAAELLKKAQGLADQAALAARARLKKQPKLAADKEKDYRAALLAWTQARGKPASWADQ